MGSPEERAWARHKNRRDATGQLQLALIPSNDFWALCSDGCPLSLACTALPGGHSRSQASLAAPAHRLPSLPWPLHPSHTSPRPQHAAPTLCPPCQPSRPRLCSYWMNRNPKRADKEQSEPLSTLLAGGPGDGDTLCPERRGHGIRAPGQVDACDNDLWGGVWRGNSSILGRHSGCCQEKGNSFGLQSNWTGRGFIPSNQGYKLAVQLVYKSQY